jgi:hypothetical protein
MANYKVVNRSNSILGIKLFCVKKEELISGKKYVSFTGYEFEDEYLANSRCERMNLTAK